MLDINSSIQKNGTLSVQNSDGTLKQVAYLSATISESGAVSMSASFNDFAAYLANDIALDSELKSFLDGVKNTYKATYSTEDNTISSDAVDITGTTESEVF
jgi:hypothetical protein